MAEESSPQPPQAPEEQQHEPSSESPPLAQQPPAAHMRAVTISREYGSGGGEIAARLAKHLGWQLIDHEIVLLLMMSMAIRGWCAC